MYLDIPRDASVVSAIIKLPTLPDSNSYADTNTTKQKVCGLAHFLFWSQCMLLSWQLAEPWIFLLVKMSEYEIHSSAYLKVNWWEESVQIEALILSLYNFVVNFKMPPKLFSDKLKDSPQRRKSSAKTGGHVSSLLRLELERQGDNKYFADISNVWTRVVLPYHRLGSLGVWNQCCMPHHWGTDTKLREDNFHIVTWMTGCHQGLSLGHKLCHCLVIHVPHYKHFSFR